MSKAQVAIVDDETAEVSTMTQHQLDAQERLITNGLQSFVLVGNALALIREHKAYRLNDHPTFEDYCLKRWKFGRRTGQRLMLAASVVDFVQEVTGLTIPNEAGAREWARLDKKTKTNVRKVVRLLVKFHDGVTVDTATAAQVTSAVNMVNNPDAETGSADDQDDTITAESVDHVPDDTIPDEAEFTDQCPHCAVVPKRYWRDKNGWHCGACNDTIFIGVIPAAYIQCDQCSTINNDSNAVCTSCGSPLEDD